MRDITYCLSCKKNTENIDPKVIKTKNNKRVIISRCSICNNKKSIFTSRGSVLFDSIKHTSKENEKRFVECF